MPQGYCQLQVERLVPDPGSYYAWNFSREFMEKGGVHAHEVSVARCILHL